MKEIFVGHKGIGEHVTKRYFNASISKLTDDIETQKSIVSWIRDPKNFFVYLGKAGCGKTYLSIAAAYHFLETHKREQIIKDKWDSCEKERMSNDKDYIPRELIDVKQTCWPMVLYYPITKIYDEIKESFNFNLKESHIKKRFFDADLLVIDDLGAMRNTEWQIQIVYEIIDARYASEKPTIVTSNMTFKEIGEVFHERIRSRLEARENKVIFDWENDLRI